MHRRHYRASAHVDYDGEVIQHDYAVSSALLRSLTNRHIETAQLLPGQLLTLAGINTPGGATLAGLLDIEVGGVSFGVDLQGIEASRAYVVPEPSSGLLLLVGLALLRGRRLR